MLAPAPSIHPIPPSPQLYPSQVLLLSCSTNLLPYVLQDITIKRGNPSTLKILFICSISIPCLLQRGKPLRMKKLEQLRPLLDPTPCTPPLQSRNTTKMKIKGKYPFTNKAWFYPFTCFWYFFWKYKNF